MAIAAAYRMESGAITTDASGNGYTLTNNGSIASGAGKAGSGAVTTGGSKYLTISSALGITSTPTFSFLVKPTVAYGSQVIFFNHQNGVNHRYYYFEKNSTNARFILSRLGTATHICSVAYTFTQNVRHYFVCVNDNTNLYLYINGVQRATIAGGGDGSTNATTLTTIGALNGPSLYAEGVYDEFVFDTAVWSAAKVKTMYAFYQGVF